MAIQRPADGEFALYYKKYVELVPQNDLLSYFTSQTENLASLLNSLPEEKLLYRYAEGKWSIKDVAQHVIDGERIFCYRALSIARADAKPLPGFEENEYAAIAHADDRSGKSLADEFTTVRTATLSLFNNFSKEALLRKGIANAQPVSVRALGYLIAGHELHHLGVIKERYLK
jgi:uncharacterized damage-inducible protein DinB